VAIKKPLTDRFKVHDRFNKVSLSLTGQLCWLRIKEQVLLARLMKILAVLYFAMVGGSPGSAIRKAIAVGVQ
jgi:hypothetical protein